MADGMNELLQPAARGVTYRVRGLTCSGCVGTALDELRALPGVERILMTLVPFGVSSVRIEPHDAATAEQVRAGLRRVGFRIVASRRTRTHRIAGAPPLLVPQA
ncbi:MAG TPA: heavy metal-associated domain-containing protein [Propionicimonas sp.]|jgi:copper chaperone CopZ